MAENTDQYTIQGRIIHASSKAPLNGYYVHAFDADRLTEDDFLGEGLTNESGEFTVEYRESEFVKNIIEFFLEGGPDLVLKVYDAEMNLIHTTERRGGASLLEWYTVELEGEPYNAPGDSSGGRIDETGFGRTLSAWRKVLGEANIHTSAHLRKAARSPTHLRRLGLDDEAIQTIAAFGALTRIFPVDVAVALQISNIRDIGALKEWSADAFEKALRTAHIAPTTTAHEVIRFTMLKKFLQSGSEAITGIELDLGAGRKLKPDESAVLAEAEVETWGDWVNVRGELSDFPKDTADRLDSYSRLNYVGINGNLAEGLIEASVSSALDLARMTGKDMQEIATRLRIPVEELAAAANRAGQQSGYAATILDQLFAGVEGIRPPWFDVLAIRSLSENTCVECIPENSAISCFAYYVYLVQRTGKTLGQLQEDLELQELRGMLRQLAQEAGSEVPDLQELLNLKDLSAVSASILVFDPLAPCGSLSLCDLLARLLQDHLDALWTAAQTSEQRKEYTYLRYEAWRAERLAHFFSELAALWRDDILTSQGTVEERGSILRNRAEQRSRIAEQMDEAIEALGQARITTEWVPISDSEFESLVGQFSSEPFYLEFLGGIQIIKDILAVDDEVQEATVALDNDQPGVALDKLRGALRYLDSIAERVFPKASPWRTDGADPLLHLANIALLPPAERKKLLQQTFDDLMSGRKLIYEPKIGIPIVIEGLRDNGSIDFDHAAWTVNNAFQETSSGFNILGESGPGFRTVKYERGDDLEDYAVSLDFTLSDRAPSADTRTFMFLQSRSQNDGISGYRLEIQSRYSGDDHFSGVTHWLVLTKVQHPEVVELGSTFIGAESFLDIEGGSIRLGHTYHLSLQVSGPALVGRLKVTPTKIVTVEAEDATFDMGSFAFRLRGNLSARIENFQVDQESDTGFVPFYSSNRVDWSTKTGKMQLERGIHWLHATSGAGMSDKLMRGNPVSVANRTATEKLHGAQRAGKEVYAVFKAGQKKVDTHFLDVLLDRSLAMLFFLRYAAIPTRLAQAYFQSGEYEKAVEFLHLLYDDTAPGDEQERQIYPNFAFPPDTFSRTVSPDARLLRLRLAEVYLAWAEWLFRRNTAEARHQARRLYERVLTLHGMADGCGCEAQIGSVREEIIARWLEFVAKGRDKGRSDQTGSTLDELFVAWPKIRDPDGLSEFIRSHDNGDLNGTPYDFSKVISDVHDRISDESVRYDEEVDKHVRYEALMDRGDSLLREAELEVKVGRGDDIIDSLLSSGSGKRFLDDGYRGGNRSSSPVDGHLEWVYGTFTYPAFCVPPNPLKAQQSSRACQMLDLINGCRNILGFTDGLVPPLRFEALLDIARFFSDQAQAAERDLLNFRQAFEQDTFSLLQAQSNLVLSEGEIGLETLGIEGARSQMRLANLQIRQAGHAINHYTGLLTEGLSFMEDIALKAAWMSAFLSGFSAGASIALSLLPLKGIGGPMAFANGIGAAGGAANSVSSAASLQASFERRQQEWQFQKVQSQFSLLSAEEGVVQAAVRFEIAQRRRQLAVLRKDFAADGVQFLSHKFLNGAMWVWLQRAIREQYRTRLNYAISAAFMAERALAFELQNQALKVIRFDYFDPKKDGLLGATRLQTDLSTLKSTKLSFTQRKLQLSRTFSLAELMPVEFEIFRRGADLENGEHLPPGIIRFSTLQDWFDHDFPGHYLRLIKNVKVTVIALVPPHQGLRGTLLNNGFSRTIVGPPFSEEFREQVIRRDPESIALSSPFQETGQFVLDFEGQLLLPFEGSGTDTDWVFELPRAANPFDYNSIADVLFTVEYTALENSDYREEVIARLGRSISAVRPFSLRQQFPDEWYHLTNPRLNDSGTLLATLQIGPEYFPRNLENLELQHVALYFARKPDTTFDISVSHLHFMPRGTGAVLGGAAMTTSAVISTRLDNAGNWVPMLGKSPIGVWELALPDTDEMRALLEDQEIEDILLVITYEGETPEWP